jgi:Ca2+/Na+ antiporter
VDFEEFSQWYIKSHGRLKAQVVDAFNHVDEDKSGAISSPEIRSILKRLYSKGVADEDVENAINEIKDTQEGGEGDITYDEFKKWYLRPKNSELSVDEAEEEGLSLYPPTGEDRTASTMFWYVCTLPFILAFMVTVPDVRMPGKQGYVYFSFAMCLAWMGIFSYFMVSWIETIGATLGIPSVIMGLTFLAAGTSVPDML